ncbi:MAG: DUF29 domain-containing protein [Neisseria sp.]|nr:DUF29 domain-containing protein [Neisseria sp.]
MTNSYETDFSAWAFQQAALLKAGQWESLDIENLVEEMESMGRSELRALESRMVNLIAHLLKWAYQPDYRGNSWKRTIVENRVQIPRLIKFSPALKKYFENPEWILDIWLDAVKTAAGETGIAKSDFPVEPIWTMYQILDDDFYPDSQLF